MKLYKTFDHVVMKFTPVPDENITYMCNELTLTQADFDTIPHFWSNLVDSAEHNA
jgi:hypothetical protein